jgi:hypothetical protein
VIALRGATTVNVSIAPSHGTKRGTKISTEGIENGVAERQPSCLITDERRIDVSASKMDTESHTKSLLAAP